MVVDIREKPDYCLVCGNRVPDKIRKPTSKIPYRFDNQRCYYKYNNSIANQLVEIYPKIKRGILDDLELYAWTTHKKYKPQKMSLQKATSDLLVYGVSKRLLQIDKQEYSVIPSNTEEAIRQASIIDNYDVTDIRRKPGECLNCGLPVNWDNKKKNIDARYCSQTCFHKYNNQVNNKPIVTRLHLRQSLIDDLELYAYEMNLEFEEGLADLLLFALNVQMRRLKIKNLSTRSQPPRKPLVE